MPEIQNNIDISIVLPAFNEAKRLPPFLKQIIAYCNQSKEIYEIIVVDDGSRDDTYEQVLGFKPRFGNLRLFRFQKNRGVGAAVREGFSKAQGRIVVLLDADGSSSCAEIEKNLFYFEQGYDIIVGSRALKGRGQALSIPLHRKIISPLFNFLVQHILFKGIKDTQCGFKMYRQEVFKEILPRMRIDGFCFDVELLYLADKMGYKLKEIPVTWQHQQGGTVKLIRDSLMMFLNILQIKKWHSNFP